MLDGQGEFVAVATEVEIGVAPGGRAPSAVLCERFVRGKLIHGQAIEMKDAHPSPFTLLEWRELAHACQAAAKKEWARATELANTGARVPDLGPVRRASGAAVPRDDAAGRGLTRQKLFSIAGRLRRPEV